MVRNVNIFLMNVFSQVTNTYFHIDYYGYLAKKLKLDEIKSQVTR